MQRATNAIVSVGMKFVGAVALPFGVYRAARFMIVLGVDPWGGRLGEGLLLPPEVRVTGLRLLTRR